MSQHSFLSPGFVKLTHVTAKTSDMKSSTQSTCSNYYNLLGQIEAEGGLWQSHSQVT
jgi:hypothetical protein